MRRHRLISAIIIAAGLMGLLLPAYNLLVVQPAVLHNMHLAAESDASRLAKHLNRSLIPTGFAFRPTDITPELGAALNRLAADFALVKLKLFDTAGTILFSTEAGEIGQVNRKAYFRQRVAGGETYSALVARGTHTLENGPAAQDVIETYVPIMHEGAFAGAVEIYYDVSERKQHLDRIMRHATWTLLGATALFLLLILFVAQRALHARRRQEQAERERQQQARLLQTIIDAIPAPIFCKDAQGVYLACNPAFERYIGRDAGRIVGHTVYDVAPKHLADAYHQADLELMQAGTPQVYEAKVQYADGSQHDVRFHKAPLRQDNGTVFGLTGIMIDISDIRQAEQEITRLACYDNLTGLPNRTLLQDRLQQALQLATRDGYRVGLLLLDLDKFKELNDSLGHAVGDEYLQEIAGRLSANVQSGDTVARLGGDEFAVLLPELADASQVSAIADRLQQQVARPWVRGGHPPFTTSASIGAVLFPVDGTSVGDLLRHADMAMFAAKEQGRGTIRFFTAELNRQAAERRAIKSSLELAFDRDELHLFFQPQVDGESLAIIGVEALVRWQHPTEGLLTPLRFIPLAEESGQIEPLGRWVLRSACQQARLWQQLGLPAWTVAANVSGRQLQDPDFVPKLSSILATAGINPSLFELELTESTVMETGPAAIERLQQLKGLGIKIAVDDFGTGYSSLSYLKHLPLDRVKIDLSFVRDIDHASDSAAIVAAIVALARSLGLSFIAEGVEREAQRQHLLRLGCRHMQGFYFARPMPAEELEKRISVVNGRAVLLPG